MEDDLGMLMDAFRESELTIGTEEWSEFPRLDELFGEVRLACTGESGSKADKRGQGLEESREEERYRM